MSIEIGINSPFGKSPSPKQFHRRKLNSRQSLERESVAASLRFESTGNEEPSELPNQSEHIFLASNNLEQSFVEESHSASVFKQPIRSKQTEIRRNKIPTSGVKEALAQDVSSYPRSVVPAIEVPKDKPHKILVMQHPYLKSHDGPHQTPIEIQSDDIAVSDLDEVVSTKEDITDKEQVLINEDFAPRQPNASADIKVQDYNGIKVREQQAKDMQVYDESINALKDEVGQLRHQNKNYLAELKRLLRDEDNKRAELQKCKEQIFSLHKQIQSFKDKNEELEMLGQDHSKRRLTDQESMKQIILELESVKRENEHLKAEHGKHDQNTRQLEQANSNVRIQLETLNRTVKQLRQDNDAMEKDLNSYKNAASRLQRENDQLREQTGTLTHENLEYKRHIKNLEQKIQYYIRQSAVNKNTNDDHLHEIFVQEQDNAPQPQRSQVQNVVSQEKHDHNTSEDPNHARFKRDVGTLQYFEPLAAKPQPTVEHSGSATPQHTVSDASSFRKSTSTPFATDMSLKEQIALTGRLDKELVSLNMHRAQLESEYQKLLQHRVRTQQALQRKVEIETEIDSITRQISKIKAQLKELRL